MNIVHNMLDKYADTPTDRKPAIKSETEDGTVRTLTYKELREQVDRMANSLRSLGLGKGDAIGVFMPMVPEIVVAMLAIIKIGGIFLPLFSGFGAAAIVSRLNDAEAKALFTAAGTYRRGKFCPMKPIADEAAAQIPTLRHLIVLNQAGEWLIEDLRPDAGPPATLPGPFDDSPTERTLAEDPMMIIYTSGTTGKPKGRGAHALRFSDQIGAGHVAWARSARRRNALLDDGHGLDDGTVGSFRHAYCSARP